ncbi:DUF3592 domain-containing protein [Nitratireductor basaltis]|uniref:DUF3592 domain-containing protein n=1 Tax=Nitratireductor basaltis TaxID=472175 RepID=A0A084U7T8_9HYPH|nr:DUF3592 domain-containing protein [Nitratireductor basaltis]KFB09024.1 hypothetical protein EL18_00038 [Nitratireductor basaltis]
MTDTTDHGGGSLLRNSHLQALLRTLVLALPFAAAFLYGLWTYHGSDKIYRGLEAHGVETQATIISKRIIRSGTDRPRYAYEMTVSFTVGDKMRRGNVSVTSGFYDRHNPPDRVTIRYMPHDPQTRQIDPAMRGNAMREALTVIAILLFIGVVNIGMARGARRTDGARGRSNTSDDF